MKMSEEELLRKMWRGEITSYKPLAMRPSEPFQIEPGHWEGSDSCSLIEATQSEANDVPPK